jgi:hypothetical protein
LGDLYTRVEKMMEKMQQQQSIAIAKKMQAEREATARKKRRLDKIRCEAWKYGVTILFILYIFILGWSVVELRIEHSPELGRCLIPKGSWLYDRYNNLKGIDCEIQQ